MGIANGTEADAADVDPRSGQDHSIARSLEQQGQRMEFIGGREADRAHRKKLVES
jgi:hypothetical protein